MNLWSLLKVAGGVVALLFTGSIWKHVHNRQAQHMREYGDTERNKYGLWK